MCWPDDNFTYARTRISRRTRRSILSAIGVLQEENMNKEALGPDDEKDRIVFITQSSDLHGVVSKAVSSLEEGRYTFL